jgi:hypothetical protein
VTLTVHPRFGEELDVLRPYGRQAVWVETSEQRVITLPLAWTTLCPRPEPLVARGRTVRLAPEALRELAGWVAARARDAEALEGQKGQEVGHFDKYMVNRDTDGGLSDEPAGRRKEDRGADARGAAPSSTGHHSAASVVEQAGSPSDRAKQRERGIR